MFSAAVSTSNATSPPRVISRNDPNRVNAGFWYTRTSSEGRPETAGEVMEMTHVGMGRAEPRDCDFGNNCTSIRRRQAGVPQRS
jgi:hypothetical protein